MDTLKISNEYYNDYKFIIRNRDNKEQEEIIYSISRLKEITKDWKYIMSQAESLILKYYAEACHFHLNTVLTYEYGNEFILSYGVLPFSNNDKFTLKWIFNLNCNEEKAKETYNVIQELILREIDYIEYLLKDQTISIDDNRELIIEMDDIDEQDKN